VDRAWRLGTVLVSLVAVLAATWVSARAVPAPVGWLGGPDPSQPVLAAGEGVPPAQPRDGGYVRPADSTGRGWPGSWRQPPAATIGKLLVETPDGPGECTGTVVNSQSKSLVVTAAHCIHGGRGRDFYRNFVFVPGLHGGARPFGEWTARAWTVPGNWAGSSDMRYDVGILVMRPKGGRRIAEVTGGQGISWNQPRGLAATALGYPRSPRGKYDGNRLDYCQGATVQGDWGRHRIACDMGQGASGGPWLARTGRSGLGVLYSVNSTYTGESYYGPYFDDRIAELYALVAAR
jgi:V8-like Glu-specific endopeptidase